MFLVNVYKTRVVIQILIFLIISNFVHLQLLDHQVLNSQLIMQEPQLIDIFTFL